VNLKSSLIFKGGTALKKSYFGDYRFSEDLDFSTTYDAPFESLLMDEISKACKYAEDRIYEYAPVKIFVKRYEEKQPHPQGQEAFKISAQFPWQSQPLTTVMIEISREEAIVFNPVIKPILHDYGEIIEQNILVYSLEEIILEKLRAILQHIKKLHERDWTRSRARDYYDLWRIFTSFEEKIVLNDFIILLEKKCILKDVYFDGLESFFDSAMIEYVSKTWKDWLGPLVPNLPDCHKVINELKMKLEFLFINSEEKLSLILQHMVQGKLKGESLYGILERALQKENDINTQNINGHKFL
jgi:predicted nucleotidyltransferase component of viral defense system